MIYKYCVRTVVGGGGGGGGGEVQRRQPREWALLSSVMVVREWAGFGEERKVGEWRR